MGSADSTDKSEAVPLQGSGVQPLVRRLQIPPPAEYFIRGQGPLNPKPSADHKPKPSNTATQIRVAANFKNTPISRRLATLPRGKQILPNAQPQIGVRATSNNGSSGCPRGAALDESLAEDLVNLLVRPDAPFEAQRLPWFLLPFLPLHIIGGWIKHILWLSARVLPWKYPRVSPNKVLSSEAVQLAISKTSERETVREHAMTEVVSKNARMTQTHRARQILEGMAACTSGTILRIAAIVVNRIFLSCLSGVHVRRDQLAKLRALSLANPGVPVIYLPLHRSHLDYILLTYTLWLHDMRLPQVAAGDNIALPVFNFLLRGLGAFFIRRRIDQDSNIKRLPKDQREPIGKDYVYRGVLQEYVCELLSMGHSLEFYMEGGRSRSGRTLPAKAGLLSVLVHAYQMKTVKDIIIVPGAVTYDKLFDGNFVEEQRGLPKKKETFGGAMCSIWGVMRAKFGSVRIEFGKPFTLKAFLRENVELFDLEQEFDLNEHDIDSSPAENISHGRTFSSASLVSASPEDQQKINKLTQCLATRILCDSTSAQALSGPSLVAFLMMTQFRSGCRESQLTSSLVELCDVLSAPPNVRSLTLNPSNGTNIGHVIKYTEWLFPNLFAFRPFTPSTENEEESSGTAVNGASSTQEQEFYAHTDQLNASLQLQYLANPVVEALLGEALLATALLAVRPERVQSSFIEDRSKTSDLLVQDIFRGNGIGENEICPVDWSSVEHIVAELCDILQSEFVYLQEPREMLETIENAKTVLIKKGLLLARTGTNLPNIRCDPQSIKRLAVLRSATAHLIEGYYTVAVLLRDMRRDPPRFCDRCLANEFLKKALSKCEKGLIEYPEGCSKDIIQNAVRLFVRWGVLVSTNSQTEQQRSEKLRTTRPSGHFYVGEQSNVESAESSSSSSSESLDNDLCIATKCLSASAGVDAYRFKISNEWTGNMDRLILKFERFRTPAAYE